MNRLVAPALLALGLPLVLLLADCLPEDLDDLDHLDHSQSADLAVDLERDLTADLRYEPTHDPAHEPPHDPAAHVSGDPPAAPTPRLISRPEQATPIDGCEAPGSGALTTWSDGQSWSLPLLHTDVDAHISGMVADVSVLQSFSNPFTHPIEAVYVFPLPDDGAVHGMTLRVGDRVIDASVHEKQEAKAIYEDAKREGRAAARLDQERPNIFRQHVANLMPGEVIEVELHLVQPLHFEDGGYEWAFPLVVGPRYVPSDSDPSAGAHTDLPDARRALDAPYSPVRTGNDVAIHVGLDAGVPLRAVRSPSHAVQVEPRGDSGSEIALDPQDTIPNKDFVLRYEVGGAQPEVALLAQRDEHDSVFMLVIQPPAEAFITDDIVTPKEMVFVVDTSCSMSGYPLDKAKDAMSLAIAEMNPDDRFLVMDFNDRVSQLAPVPLPNTIANRRKGTAFVEAFRGSGGTRMLSGIEASLDLPSDPELLRTVLFLTDGYIGNEADILAAIDQRLGARTRLYSLGIGSSVNRYLLDRMADAGRGDVEYVLHDEQADAAVRNLYERIRNPIVTDLEVDFGDADVRDVQPDPLRDLFAGQPLVLMGRYDTPGPVTVTVRGQTRQGPFEQRLDVVLPERAEQHPGLSALWARSVVDDLESRNRDGQDPALNDELLELALDHGLVTRLTSMVAVDSVVSNPGGAQETRDVPLETPQGVDLEAAAGPVGSDGLAHPQRCDFGDAGEGGSGVGGGMGAFGSGGGGGGYGYGSGGGGYGTASGLGGGSGTLGVMGGSKGGLLGGSGRQSGLGGLGSRGRGGSVAPPAPITMPRSGERSPAPEASAAVPHGIEVPSAPEVTHDDAIVLGSIDKSVIDRIVRQQLNGVRACYQRGLQLRPNLSGKVVARFVIAESGVVSAVTLSSSTLGDESVERCIHDRLIRMVFPEPAGGGVVIVTYPFVFTPADE